MRAKPVQIDIAALIDALPAALVPLAQRGVARAYPKGALLIQEGDVGDSIYIILAGSLRAFCASTTRDRELTFGTYGPGDYVGELGLDGGARTASVMAVAPSICVLVTRRTLEGYIAEYPPFAFDLLAKVIRRARTATLTARQLALNDVYGAIKQRLESLARSGPGGVRVVDKMTHRDLANLVGCGREMVTRVLNELEKGGYIAADGPLWRLLRPLPGSF